MKSRTALFLQIAIVLLGLATLAFLLWEPHVEGRNAQATIFEIYFKDPFLAYVYVGSVPFFVALHRAFGLFGSVRQSGTFSTLSVDALRTIKRCAFLLIGLVAGGAVMILLNGDQDDRPAGLFMSLLAIAAASAMAFVSALFARHLEDALVRSGGGRR